MGRNSINPGRQRISLTWSIINTTPTKIKTLQTVSSSFANGKRHLTLSFTRVPIWQQGNRDYDVFRGLGDAGIHSLQSRWRTRSVQTWNPMATPESEAVLRPVHAGGNRESSSLSCLPAGSRARHGQGTFANPFTFDSDDDDTAPPPRLTASSRPPTMLSIRSSAFKHGRRSEDQF